MSFNYHHIRTHDFSAPTGGGAGATLSRENYEVYFVMYVDNELNDADRKAVEHFIQQNPDLEEELVMLQQSVLRADEEIVFEQKELLFKDAAATLQINEQNCEEFFVLYSDDELTNKEKDLVEQFVYKHPQYQAAFELIQQVRLVPDNTLTFPDKTYLFRTEEDDSRVVIFPWWRLSAAAIALLVIGSLAWYISSYSGNRVITGDVVTTNTEDEKNTGPRVAQKNNTDITNTTPDKGVAIAETNTVSPTVDTKQPVETTVQSARKKNLSGGSNIQQPVYVKQESEQRPENPAGDEKTFSIKPVIVTVGNLYEKPVVKSGIIKRTINEPLAVNTVVEKPEDENEPAQHAILTASINKTPLRGFFRKVSRVVDKVTNPEDNGNGGIRIANLEIARK
jgi:hypothetical protein